MGSDLKAVRRSKEDKKVLRKQIKASHTLLKHEGIATSTQPTKVNCSRIVMERFTFGQILAVSQEKLTDCLL